MKLRRSLCLAFFLSFTLRGQNGPPTTPLYQIEFPPPPANGTDAVTTMPDRTRIVISTLACGEELEFFGNISQPGETVQGMVMAKLMFSSTIPKPDGIPQQGTICGGKGQFSVHDAQNWFPNTQFWSQHPDPAQVLSDADLQTLAQDFSAAVRDQLGCSIDGPQPDFAVVFRADPVSKNGYLLDAQFSVSQRCMQSEINHAIPKWNVKGSAGTDGLPCVDQLSFLYGLFDKEPLKDIANFLGKEMVGDWDVQVRDLTRIYYLDSLYGPVLDQPSHDHIRNDLLTLDRSPGPDSYSVLQCGNTGDNHTGSPEQRADDNNAGANILQSIGDSLGWLLNRLIVLAAAEGPVLTALEVAFPEAAVVLPGLSAVVLEGASTAMIPETENHRLMIESSRYLNNSLIAKGMPVDRPDDSAKYQAYADQGKQWLLKRMQSILANDFIEYNGRPYQRYSVISLYNLRDFAPDPEVRTMAGMVLEYADLKFAMAGNQSRRSVPFRRRQELTDLITSIMDSASGDDYQVSQILFLTGQTQQTPGPRLVSRAALAEMIHLATSTYRPDPQIIDLAIRKPVAYYERLAHSGGVEIYSGAPGYTISAGGIETDPAYVVTVDGYSAGAQDDRGTGVPTALILNSGSFVTDRMQFVRIEGVRTDYGSSGNPDYPAAHFDTYNHNTCVWHGFACGVNVVVPPVPCPASFAAVGNWNFIDTTSCDDKAAKVYVAIYFRPCDGGDKACVPTSPSLKIPNQGFFEAVDNPADDFKTFQAKIMAANPQPLDAAASTGTYHSYGGEVIAFDTEAHQHNTRDWGIRSVNGAAQPDLRSWPAAQGDIVNASGDGHIHITFPASGGKIDFGYSNSNAPVRTPQ